MPCYYPVGVYRNDGSPAYRPCGSCIGCRLEYSRQWALRCVHEASLHDENSFITLTYNNNNLPRDGSVSKDELQKFIKRLRRRIEPTKIRYFGCGEYGSKFDRPHYHIGLFGYAFPDREAVRPEKRSIQGIISKGPQSHTLYRSDLLEEVWTKGFSTVGELSFESAGYIARYCTKKINGEMASKHYKGKTPEFALMSRMPGVGKPWFDKFGNDVFPKDFTTFNGRKMRPPKYYDSLLEKSNPKLFEKIKEERKKEKPYQSHLRLYQREKLKKHVTQKLRRDIENV